MGAAAPALAQHAGGHTGLTETEQTNAEPEDNDEATPGAAAAPKNTGDNATDHLNMDHSAMGDAPMDRDTIPAMDHDEMDRDVMDHSQMGDSAMEGMGQMDHSQMGQGDMSMPIPDAPPPPAAGSGPARAADAVWGAEAMRGARDKLRSEQGGQTFFWIQGERAEYRIREGKNGYLWDIQGFYGGDIDKFWFKSEGEGSFGEEIEAAEVQALWSRAIGPWFDFQAGVRQDFAPRDRTYAAVGVQGLAPYLFELDVAAFLSDRGDLTARLEGEIDQRITQRLILQPRAEINLAAQDIPELAIGAGIDTAELGLRLRYEIAREFAPYIGVEQEWKLDKSADYARAGGEDPSVTNFVVGLRFWF
ncbi:copper resistance protein B [Pacificimonas flava]|nr:copper resistance protein B [Pacificimonas flava]MBB5279071.1 copper resistance protein B [Pacificimonas flava]